jgi:hypothetical protein
LKGALAKALKTDLTIDDHRRLINFLDSLPLEGAETEQLDDIPPDNSSVDASHSEAGNVI